MIIIQQGDLVLTDRILTGDLLIDGDKIVAIDEHVPVPEGAKVLYPENLSCGFLLLPDLPLHHPQKPLAYPDAE